MSRLSDCIKAVVRLTPEVVRALDELRDEVEELKSLTSRAQVASMALRQPIETLPSDPTGWIVVYGLEEDGDVCASALKKPSHVSVLADDVDWIWWSYLPPIGVEREGCTR